jgi:hypothetical protein
LIPNVGTTGSDQSSASPYLLVGGVLGIIAVGGIGATIYHYSTKDSASKLKDHISNTQDQPRHTTIQSVAAQLQDPTSTASSPRTALPVTNGLGSQQKMKYTDTLSAESLKRVTEVALAHIANEEDQSKTFPIKEIEGKPIVQSTNGLHKGLSDDELFALSELVGSLRNDVRKLSLPGTPSNENVNFENILKANSFASVYREFQKLSTEDKDAYLKWRMYKAFTNHYEEILLRFDEAQVLTNGIRSKEIKKMYEGKYDWRAFPDNEQLSSFARLSDPEKMNILRKGLDPEATGSISNEYHKSVLLSKYAKFYEPHLNATQKKMAQRLYAQHGMFIK